MAGLNEARYTHKRVALALFALLTGIYLLTTGGHTNSKDEELLFGVTETLVVWQSVALNAARPEATPLYSPYSPGQSVVTMPLYLVGQGIASFFPHEAYPWVTRVAVLWFNPIVTAVHVALIYLAVALLGYGRRIAIGTALLYGLATFAWHYTKTFFAEPFTTLLLFASFVVALYEHHHSYPTSNSNTFTPYLWLLVSGLLAGSSAVVKVHAGLALPFLGLFAWVAPYRWPLRFHWSIVYRALAWGIGALAGLCLLGWYQWVVYGDPFSSGYGGVDELFNPKYFVYRFNGLVWSAGRGFIWYAPPLMLMPVGMWLLWKRHRPVALLCAGITISHLIFYALYRHWHGSGAWGPRHIFFALPFMVLPVAAFLHTVRGRATPWRTGLLLLTLLLAVPVQVGSLAIANEAFFSTKRNVHRDPYDPWDSAIAGHLSMVGQHIADYYKLYAAPNSASLLRGFSYSEGDREKSEQFPRWTRPEATIALRPPRAADHLRVALSLNGCLQAPLPPAQVTLRAGEQELFVDTACPARVYRVLLPAQRAKLMLHATPWEPADVGIERHGPLGVMLRFVQVYADDEPVTIHGELVPISPMPTGYVSIRRWTGDHRFIHWDFWWWYVLHSDLPPVPLVTFALVWLSLALALVAWGGRQVWRGFRDAATNDSDIAR